jgi:hypothetical protein
MAYGGGDGAGGEEEMPRGFSGGGTGGGNGQEGRRYLSALDEGGAARRTMRDGRTGSGRLRRRAYHSPPDEVFLKRKKHREIFPFRLSFCPVDAGRVLGGRVLVGALDFTLFLRRKKVVFGNRNWIFTFYQSLGFLLLVP